MSRTRYAEDLAYGDIPQRWDRDRFERHTQRPASRVYDDEVRITERERPGFGRVTVAEREASRGPRGRFDERDMAFEEERFTTRPRRRTDRELFGDIDPREVAHLALAPYRPREEFDADLRAPPPRPGLLRRQSSLDTFDRKPTRYVEKEYRVPPYTPIPLPVRRRREWEDRDGVYREVEYERERSVHRRRPKSVVSEKEEVKSVRKEESASSSSSEEEVEESKTVVSKKSRATSRAPSRAPSVRTARSRAPSTRAVSVHESAHESRAAEVIATPSVHESVHESAYEESMREERRFKKGKTRMPKRLVRREAIMDLGYPFDEEEDFFVLRIALEKEQIDEVIRITEVYKDGEKKKIYRFEERVDEVETSPRGRESIERTEWINPPTIVGSRAKSVARTIRDDFPPPAPPAPPTREVFEDRTTLVEERRPDTFFEERRTVIEERAPSRHRHHHHHHSGSGALVLTADRDHRSDREIADEIRQLEAERRHLRHDRDRDELQLVEYRVPGREVLEVVDEPRTTVRVEKDRKGRMALVRSAH